LVVRPSLILADEPTGALDSVTSRDIIKLFHELNAAGKTIIMITHDNEIAQCAKRIIRVRDGRIVSS
jgi:putative ABC transport system ATP-binding protein